MSKSPLTFALLLLFIPFLVQAQVPDALINPGFEDPWTTPEKAFEWQDFHNGYTRVVSTDQARTGSASIRIRSTDTSSLSGAFQRIDLQQTEIKPVFVGGYVRGRNLVGAPDSFFGASIYAEIHLEDGSVAYWNSLRNFGSFDWRWVGFNTGTLLSVNQPIDHIFVVPIIGNTTGVAWFDDIVVSEQNPHQSAVTIMIDDGETSTYTEARPILDDFDFDASIAIVTELIGEDGYMSIPQLHELKDDGWEIMSHGLTHTDLTTLSPIRQLRELVISKLRLMALGFEVYNFALPFGAYNDFIMGEGAKIYSSIRAYELGDNPQGAYPYEIKVRSVINTTTEDDIEEWLEEAKNNNRWVVFAFHTIAENGDDAFHVTPDDFEEMMEEIKESGVQVVTYNEGLNMFKFDGGGGDQSELPPQEPEPDPEEPDEGGSEEEPPAEEPPDEEETRDHDDDRDDRDDRDQNRRNRRDRDDDDDDDDD